MKTLITLKSISEKRYYVELVKVVNPAGYTYYRIFAKRCGRNGRWYNSHSYEWTEIAALRKFQHKVTQLHSVTNWN